MLDYHLHLWEHSQSEVSLNLEQIAAYCGRAQAAGVTELALTEHLFRFTQAAEVVGKFWDSDEPSPELRQSMADYFAFHARNDLDAYVECAQEAKRQGLPVVIGLEVDYYPGQMEAVAELLCGYPFDVLIGSIHWLGAWRFDDLSDPVSMAEWEVRQVDACWEAYTGAIEELSATGAVDVLAHPDLIKVCGHVPAAPEEWFSRIAEAAAAGRLAAEVSSAGWRKPVGEQYPADPLLRGLVDRGVPLTTASDAHRLELVADRAGDLRSLLAGLGVDQLQGFTARVPHAVAVSSAPVDSAGGA